MYHTCGNYAYLWPSPNLTKDLYKTKIHTNFESRSPVVLLKFEKCTRRFLKLFVALEIHLTGLEDLAWLHVGVGVK